MRVRVGRSASGVLHETPINIYYQDLSTPPFIDNDVHQPSPGSPGVEHVVHILSFDYYYSFWSGFTVQHVSRALGIETAICSKPAGLQLRGGRHAVEEAFPPGIIIKLYKGASLAAEWPPTKLRPAGIAKIKLRP